jgi:hypothetical protein
MLRTSALVAAAAVAAAAPAHAKTPMNAINVIAPYKLHGTWMFDDPAKGLQQEAFVSGADTWMDRVTSHIPNAQRGFALVFSAQPFPGHQFRLERRQAEGGGRWYHSPELKMDGWLCSALFRYFDAAPELIYAEVKPIPGKSG